MNILQRLKSGAGKATERAQNAVEVNRMNGHIVDIEREIGVHYMRMGEVFYEGYRAGDMSIAEEEMTELCKACDLLNEEIEEIRTRIAILKNERICECGTVVALDANFCPNCGRKMEKLATPRSEREATDEREASYESGLDALVSSPRRDEQELDLSELTGEETEQRRAERLREDQERQDELDRLVRAWKQDLGIPLEEEQEDTAQAAKSASSTSQTATPAPTASSPSLTKTPEATASEGDTLLATEPVEAPEPETVDPGTFNCQVCGKALPKGSKWCPSCGTEQVV
ncbi:zinc ribbon domain-containing protein [Paenibacillus hunanensis]|uniref:zinc ribbon domain-containing protein n=1 Tax=Paenibacillus hunanensis TaxID=539262 RepID=UPI002A6B7512|nr:zinc ribbon domain-containing protein [Paenibacillus hunanensis]WPP41061.1 zinc ribbon domain-containing protein [Paenibacillus hunanensis]